MRDLFGLLVLRSSIFNQFCVTIFRNRESVYISHIYACSSYSCCSSIDGHAWLLARVGLAGAARSLTVAPAVAYVYASRSRRCVSANTAKMHIYSIYIYVRACVMCSRRVNDEYSLQNVKNYGTGVSSSARTNISLLVMATSYITLQKGNK